MGVPHVNGVYLIGGNTTVFPSSSVKPTRCSSSSRDVTACTASDFDVDAGGGNVVYAHTLSIELCDLCSKWVLHLRQVFSSDI